MQPRPIELLAPAKNVECGIEAINHGADAVYIGAERFGARSAAGNSVADIARLVEHAHMFRARVYVALNTILRDDELPATEELAWALYRVGVDALIVQDVALLTLRLPPIPLHASTQMDNRTPEKVEWLQKLGFQQVVLARELSLSQIAAIHRACRVPLEVFVHGALCVSYSGQCYASQACFGRSANRGECAQFCRLKFDLVDARGEIIEQGRHFLSLRDMNRADHLEALLDAGVTSFKIEGRLKDVGYVKNITAYYRQRLDEVLARRPEYRRSSSGRVKTTFAPAPEKSFNRGFTTYYLDGTRQDAVHAFLTPKSVGERVGTVKEVRGGCIIVAGVARFNNGDGLCFYDEQGRLQGFRVNRAEANKLYPAERPRVQRGTVLYRNLDQEFERILARPSGERRLAVRWEVAEVEDGFALTLTDEEGVHVTARYACEHVEARTPQAENLRRQLSRLGDTPLQAEAVEIRTSAEWFIPSSTLADWRRDMVARLLEARRQAYPQEWRPQSEVAPVGLPQGTAPGLTYLANVMNGRAEAFYRRMGAESVQPAFERAVPEGSPVLMFCKHCLRHALGACPKQGGKAARLSEPLYLVSADGRRFRLGFDCRNCQMLVYAD